MQGAPHAVGAGAPGAEDSRAEQLAPFELRELRLQFCPNEKHHAMAFCRRDGHYNEVAPRAAGMWTGPKTATALLDESNKPVVHPKPPPGEGTGNVCGCFGCELSDKGNAKRFRKAYNFGIRLVRAAAYCVWPARFF